MLDTLVFFQNNCLSFDCDGAHTIIEPWGKNSFRVRTLPHGSTPPNRIGR